MKLLKASAGSGKTYRLAHKYLELLLSSKERYAYRHILAVTFTNKATAEMKSRILKDLNEAGKDNPEARRMLVDMLHDYSAFAVSTIDRFFQQSLKAFCREIGQFASYQVELDKQSLINESMDRILDNLTEDKKELVEWLKKSVMDKVEQGCHFSLDEDLHEMGSMLKSEDHRKMQILHPVDDAEAFSKEKLDTIRTSCRKVIKDFEKGAASFGLEVEAGKKIKVPGKKARAANPDMAQFFEEGYALYNTASIIDKMLFSLGVAGEFYREFDTLLKEKNVLPLEDSNTILKDIIAGSDVPFIYEKLGVRYEHFLLDEFQDTSGIQWENFLPLLHESDDNGRDNLIVGDVKQSIYRFRDSDWKLLGEEVQKEFPSADVESMEYNWRSTRRVVDFNKEFFNYAASQIGASDIYKDVNQKPKTEDKQEGYVKVRFCDDQGAAVLDSIKSVRERGARWNDITILVRNGKEGSGLASLLINNGIPVISEGSLSLKSSATVRRLVSLLNSIESPTDSIGNFLTKSMNITLPESFHSLADLCEGLIRQLQVFDPKSFEGETPFLEAFMDDVQSWSEVNGNNLRAYLEHWKEAKLYIGSPENADSVRIMTIHKSKGLEFPIVIFPFADKVSLFKITNKWCWLDASGTALGSEVNGLYPVSLSGTSKDTLFAEDYFKERDLQAVDNINIFYVALTRAVAELHVIAKQPSQTMKDNLAKGKKTEWTNYSEMLYVWCGQFEERSFGEAYDFSRYPRKKASGDEVNEFPASYPSIPAGSRVKASQDALDFFGDNGSVGSAASARLHGIELHKILSAVQYADDLPRGISPEVYELLSERIAAHPEWFLKTRDNAEAGRVFNELTIIGTDGEMHRPDRVVEGPDGVTVIDYKFGAADESHIWQVRRYVNLYRKMGYSNVRGAIWYVPSDSVVPVD